VSSAKSPQEKKQLSLERDRRNVYGENAKSSRKNIPKSKRLSQRAARKAANTPLQAIKGGVREEEAIAAELASRTKQIERRGNAFVKQPDLPLGVVLRRKNLKKQLATKAVGGGR
jgi:hypothetical protein